MVNFGLIDDWKPPAGRVTIWSASLASITQAQQAPIHPTPPSHQQEEYLRTAACRQNSQIRSSRLYVGTFDQDHALDHAAMTAAVNAFLRRHDTHLSWFSIEPDDSVARRVIDPATIDFIPHHHDVIGDPDEIRELVQRETPGPFEWDCFTFGTIEHDCGFTMYAAIDHLHSDPISQAISLVDAIALYDNARHGRDNDLAPPGSYIDYCHRERTASAQLSLDSPPVQRWIELVQANGGRLPTFPLDLGQESTENARSAHLTVTLFDEGREDTGPDLPGQSRRVHRGGTHRRRPRCARIHRRPSISGDHAQEHTDDSRGVQRGRLVHQSDSRADRHR